MTLGHETVHEVKAGAWGLGQPQACECFALPENCENRRVGGVRSCPGLPYLPARFSTCSCFGAL